MNYSLPLVSVIVACYNHEDYIDDCLTSILRQTYQNIELIVIDDGSKDQSASIIEKLARQHQFYFEVQSNIGLAPTLNKGIALSKGDYVITFGSDDIMMLDRVEKQVIYMESNPDIGVCGGNIINIDEHGKLHALRKFHDECSFNFNDLFLERKNGIPAATLFFRRKALLDAECFHPEIKLEDVYIVLKITSLGYLMGVMNDLLAYYRVHPKNTYKNYRYMVENILKTYDQFSEQPSCQEMRYKYINSMFAKCANKDKQLAKELLGMLPLKNWNMKTLKGLGRYIFR